MFSIYDGKKNYPSIFLPDEWSPFWISRPPVSPLDLRVTSKTGNVDNK